MFYFLLLNVNFIHSNSILIQKTMVLLKVFKDFAATTSIHSLTFLVNPQLSVVKRISWAVLIIGAVIYAGYQLNITFACKFGWFKMSDIYYLCTK